MEKIALFESFNEKEKLTFDVPFVVITDDYHNFSELQRVIRIFIGTTLKYTELKDEPLYSAVFYLNEVPMDTKGLKKHHY
jgi:hypothetical protein